MERYIEYPWNTPKMEKKDIKFLWYSGWWDGPQSGFCEVHGRKMYFQCCREVFARKDRKKYKFWRRFLLYDLKPEEWEEELKWHQLFREKVGINWDTDDEGNRVNRDVPLQSYELHHEFYEPFNEVKDEMRTFVGKREPYAYFDLT